MPTKDDLIARFNEIDSLKAQLTGQWVRFNEMGMEETTEMHTLHRALDCLDDCLDALDRRLGYPLNTHGTIDEGV